MYRATTSFSSYEFNMHKGETGEVPEELVDELLDIGYIVEDAGGSAELQAKIASACLAVPAPRVKVSGYTVTWTVPEIPAGWEAEYQAIECDLIISFNDGAEWFSENVQGTSYTLTEDQQSNVTSGAFNARVIARATGERQIAPGYGINSLEM